MECDHSAYLLAGIEHIILAMPHRGRLNLLTEPTLLKYSPTALFHKVKGKGEIPEEFDAAGDVISHLGTYCFLLYADFSDLSTPVGSYSCKSQPVFRGGANTSEDHPITKPLTLGYIVFLFIFSQPC